MGNPFNNATQTQKITINDALDMFKQMINMGSDPNQIINILTTQNPQMSYIFNEIKKSGLSPIEYAKKMAMQQNINVNPMIEQMINLTKNR